jgi:hypothetical protein
LLVSLSSGTCTNAGSPSFELRSMNARWYADERMCAYAALPNGGSESYVSSMLSVSVIVTPPDEDGGIVYRR